MAHSHLLYRLLTDVLLYAIIEQSALVFTELKSKRRGETHAETHQKIVPALEEELDDPFPCFDTYAER